MNEKQNLREICEIFGIPYNDPKSRREVVKNFTRLRIDIDNNLSARSEEIFRLHSDIMKQKSNRKALYDMYRAGAIKPTLEQFVDHILLWSDLDTYELLNILAHKLPIETQVPGVPDTVHCQPLG